jgi:hypothetical protein
LVVTGAKIVFFFEMGECWWHYFGACKRNIPASDQISWCLQKKYTYPRPNILVPAKEISLPSTESMAGIYF